MYKLIAAVAVVLLSPVGGVMAASQTVPEANPFVKDVPPPPPPPPPPSPPPPAQPMPAQMGFPPPLSPPLQVMPAPIPSQFTDNRTVFDSLAVVGINGDYALLRYPMTSTGGTVTQAGGAASGAGGQQFRLIGVTDGAPVWLGGKRYLAKVVAQSVRLISVTPAKKIDKWARPSIEEVVWSGDLEAPRGYPVSPNPQDLH